MEKCQIEANWKIVENDLLFKRRHIWINTQYQMDLVIFLKVIFTANANLIISEGWVVAAR